MYEVTCFRCLRIVHITPDNEHCSVCGEDLKHLMPPAYTAQYFYDRAAQFASDGQLQAGLAEVERGLNYGESAELHLLGGILAKRLSNFDLMRQHVAAIPLDDVLRQEAEWLLRSHQTRQRNLRQADKKRKPGRGAHPLEEESLPFALDEVAPSPLRPHPTAGGAWLSLLALLVVVGAGWLFLGRTLGGLKSLWPSGNPAIEQTIAGGQTSAVDEPATRLLTITPPALIVTPTLALSLTPEIPNNIAQQVTTPEPLAATTPRSAVDALDTVPFDFKNFLLTQNRPALADLNVSSTLQGTKLKLKGIVQMDAERRAIVAMASAVPDVTDVDAVDLLVRLPETYTVQEGDTLWDITLKLYGDARRMPELIHANADQITSPEAIRVGMRLKVPPN